MDPLGLGNERERERDVFSGYPYSADQSLAMIYSFHILWDSSGQGELPVQEWDPMVIRKSH